LCHRRDDDLVTLDLDRGALPATGSRRRQHEVATVLPVANVGSAARCHGPPEGDILVVESVGPKSAVTGDVSVRLDQVDRCRQRGQPAVAPRGEVETASQSKDPPIRDESLEDPNGQRRVHDQRALVDQPVARMEWTLMAISRSSDHDWSADEPVDGRERPLVAVAPVGSTRWWPRRSPHPTCPCGAWERQPRYRAGHGPAAHGLDARRMPLGFRQPPLASPAAFIPRVSFGRIASPLAPPPHDDPGPPARTGVAILSPGRGRGRLDQGRIRWTGLPRMLTCHVVVSLPPLTWYSTFHQPCSVSPDGLRHGVVTLQP